MIDFAELAENKALLAILDNKNTLKTVAKPPFLPAYAT
tara:strand:+ start:3702 stop:3815 length:114 start_codon:yes stop_codon:yes gene_type:complete